MLYANNQLRWVRTAFIYIFRETTLKPRESVSCFKEFTNPEKIELLKNVSGFVEVDPPNNNLYAVEGTIILESGKKFNYDINQILLRVRIFK